MSSGKYIDLLDFKPSDLDMFDINNSLNYTYRFSGHHKDAEPLTVAQHTLLVANLARELFGADDAIYRACIIHDFGETYYGDITTPVKRIMGDAFYDFVRPIDEAIEYGYYGERVSDEVHEAVKVCDLLALDIERRTMWNSQIGKEKWPATPDNQFSLLDKRAMFEEVSQLRDVDFSNFL